MRCLTIILLILWAPFAAAYEETLKIPGSPELRVALGPRDAAENFGYVEAEFVLRLQLVSAFAFEALNFAPPVIENARVVRVMTPRTKAVSTYVASGFIFETAYAIFPDRPGELVIPPIVAEGVIEPTPGAPVPFRSETVEQRIIIKGIPPEFQGDWWVVTPRVEVEEVWSSPPEEAHVGDVIRREVTMKAYGVDADRLPDLALTGSQGVVVSDHGGARDTQPSTNGVIGKVSRSWDIRIVDPRVAVVGAVTMEHWHPSYHRSITVSAPFRRLEPAPANPEANAEALMVEASRSRRAGLAAGVALGVLILSPFVVLAFALTLAAAPSAADRKLKRALSGATSLQEAWKAVDGWATESGISLSDTAESHRRLSGAVFSSGADRPDLTKVTADLLAASRKARLVKLRAKANGWLASVIGPKAILND